MFGNLLLDVGPKPDGTIPEKQVFTLKELGKWIKKHEEAVYATVGGLPFGHFFGSTSFCKDSSTIYLYYFESPRGEVSVKGIGNEIKTIRGKEKLQAPIDDAAISMAMVHYANVAYRINSGFDIDQTGRFLDRKAMVLWSRSYEPGWEIKL